MGLKLQDVPAAAGWRWVKQGFGEYFRHPLAYIGLFMAFLFAVLLTMLLPWIGGVLLMLSVPLLSLGFMMATHASLRERPVHAGVFLLPWQQREPDRRAPLLVLLVAYAVLTAMALWWCEWVDGGAFDAWLTALAKGNTPPDELARLGNAPGASAGALWRFGLSTLLSIPFWFAPALVFWAQQGVAQALFSSTLALWRARGAFLVFGIGWLAVLGLAGTLTSVIAAVLGPAATSLLAMPVGLVLTAVFYVSLYFSFRDCFGEP
ncbi:BPSS1780 family membrane protein [Ideonella sp.]|uniref:BPSS1780 family membrane protein n=1 Tax=Ideonella sp. TaxID=1929293 RepID=UPI0035AF6F5D